MQASKQAIKHYNVPLLVLNHPRTGTKNIHFNSHNAIRNATMLEKPIPRDAEGVYRLKQKHNFQ
jgi:hypothetical protein